jgi:DNA-binding FrmR family transcriptional regulator
MTYAKTITLDLPYDQAVPRVKEAFKAQGFGTPEHVMAAARRRLRRTQGQLGGIATMIEQGRSCRDVRIQQIAEAGKALDPVGVSLLVSQLQYCLEDEEAAREKGYGPAEVERLFMSLT